MKLKENPEEQNNIRIEKEKKKTKASQTLT